LILTKARSVASLSIPDHRGAGEAAQAHPRGGDRGRSVPRRARVGHL